MDVQQCRESIHSVYYRYRRAFSKFDLENCLKNILLYRIGDKQCCLTREAEATNVFRVIRRLEAPHRFPSEKQGIKKYFPRRENSLAFGDSIEKCWQSILEKSGVLFFFGIDVRRHIYGSTGCCSGQRRSTQSRTGQGEELLYAVIYKK